MLFSLHVWSIIVVVIGWCHHSFDLHKTFHKGQKVNRTLDIVDMVKMDMVDLVDMVMVDMVSMDNNKKDNDYGSGSNDNGSRSDEQQQ